MSKKHFRALAQALHNVKPVDGDPVARDVWIDTVMAVAATCSKFNDLFSLSKFLQACEDGL